MDKRALLAAMVARVEADLATLTQAALAAHEAATHEESRPEDKYDTRGLEAAYLAGAQSKRVLELQEMATVFRHLDLQRFGPESPIVATALVELTGEAGATLYFLLPLGGGLQGEVDGRLVHVVTPQAPLGAALMGRRLGDDVEVRVQGSVRDYEITGVW